MIKLAVLLESKDFFSSLSFSDCFSPALDSTRVSITAGSMSQHLDPTAVAQVVQLLQDCTSVGAIVRRFGVSQHGLNSTQEIPGDRQLF